MIKCTLLFLLLALVPFVLGAPWLRYIKCKYTVAFAYAVGFLMELVSFHIVVFPATILKTPFHLIVWIYSTCLGFCCIICLILIRKNGLAPQWNKIRGWKKFTWYEWILLIAVIIVIGIQVVRGFTKDITLRSYDDATYVVMATDTLEVDQIGVTDSFTGVATYLEANRISQTWLVFPAYLASVTGISIPTIAHTIQYVQMILLAYITYIYLSGELFDDRINRLIFLLVLAFTFIYGYYNHYSLTLRLLGANYQGKMILAVTLTPLVLAIMIRKLSEPYQWQTGLLLFMISVSAIALTLWGTGTMAVDVGIPVVVSMFRKKRDWKHLLYIPWACVAPAVFTIIYMVYRFAI